MAVQTRNARGAFTTGIPRDERTVAEIIRQLALKAAERYDKDPTEVTQAQCNSCAGAQELVEAFGDIPKIHGLLAQLPDRDGKPYRYRKLLHDLFDKERTFEGIRREILTAEDWPDLDAGHIDYALNRVADFKAVTTFPVTTYDVARDDLIRAEAQRHRSPRELASRLPTSDQIIRFYSLTDDTAAADEDAASEEKRTEIWNRALVSHGLDVQPSAAYQARAVRVPEAIRRFYEKTGLLPSKKQLIKFARYFQFSLEDWKRPWREALDTGRATISEAGFAEPPPYRPRQDKPVWEDEHGSRPWDERDARHRPKHFWTSEAMVLEKVGEFVRNEVGRGRPASQDRYQEWAARGPERPSTQVLERYGGLKALVKKVTRAGELERARREAERQANPTPKELAAKKQTRLAEIVANEQCQKILAVVTECGIVSRRGIEETLGWGKGTANAWLPYLRQAGLIVCTTENPQVANARYRLPGEWNEEDQAAAARKHAEELLGHPNGQATWNLLKARGQVTSAEVAEACEFSQATAQAWLMRFVELGYAEKHETWRGRGGGRKVEYRLPDEADSS